MMKSTFAILIFLIPFISFSQHTISGKVVQSENQEALSGATIRLKNSYLATSSKGDGSFTLKGLPSDSQTLVVSFIGYEKVEKTISPSHANELVFELQNTSVQTDEVIVSATRVNENTPTTVMNVSKEEIEENNLGQDMPYLLKQTPSVVVTSDAGTGIGYTGMRIRGIDQNRINVTINGIPLNDAESHGTFWVNMPDFASSLENIQIQRGVGTSTNGAAAFGATVNLQTSTIKPQAFAEVNNSFGSFNTKKHTVKFGSGMLNEKFAFEGRLSKINSDGYIDRASSDLQSYFFSGGYYGEKTIVKAVIFGGAERTYQSWYGTPQSRIENDREAMLEHAQNEGYSEEQTENLLNSGRTYNFYTYDNQVDDYKQNHYQLHFSHQFAENLMGNVSFHYTKGAGFYESFKPEQDFSIYLMDEIEIGDSTINTTDLVNRKWLDNDFYGLTYSFNYELNKKLKFTLGGGYNIYEGDHFGEVIWAQFASNISNSDHYYSNLGTKTDFNSYLKTEYALSEKFNFLTDIQIRNIDYSVNGYDDDQTLLEIDENYNFINPKVGINYLLNSSNSLYAFFGIAHREPNRTDLIDQPEEVASKPEQLRNLELGYELRKRNYMVAANMYYMDYDNQLVLTGELNDIGTPIKQNIKESYRSGLEIQAAYKFLDNFSILVNGTLSRNKMTREEIGETDIAYSPEKIAFLEFIYEPLKNLEISLANKYVSDQFLDNTSNENRKLDEYYYSNLRLSYSLKNVFSIKEIELSILVNNILDHEYSANGYTYSYVYGEKITENFYYPQAGRNYLVGLNLRF